MALVRRKVLSPGVSGNDGTTAYSGFQYTASMCCLITPPFRIKALLWKAFIVFFVVWMSSGNAQAALGLSMSSGKSPSIAASGSALPSVSLKSTHPLITSRSTTHENGLVVTEYAGTNSVVFAVQWTGPVLPELNVLLDKYFGVFQTEVAKSRKYRNIGSPLRIDTPELVAQSFGRMGNFTGMAFAPALIPAGVNINEVFP